MTLTSIAILGKGGVGKSTIAAGLAQAYAEAGHKTYLVELDEQGSQAERWLEAEPALTISDVLLQNCTLQEAAYPTAGGFLLVPATTALEDTIEKIARPGQRSNLLRLQLAVNALPSDSIVIFDTLPKLSDFATESALMAMRFAVAVAGPQKAELRKADEIRSVVEQMKVLGKTYLGMVGNKCVSLRQRSAGQRRDLSEAIALRDDCVGMIFQHDGKNAEQQLAQELKALSITLCAKMQGA